MIVKLRVAFAQVAMYPFGPLLPIPLHRHVLYGLSVGGAKKPSVRLYDGEFVLALRGDRNEMEVTAPIVLASAAVYISMADADVQDNSERRGGGRERWQAMEALLTRSRTPCSCDRFGEICYCCS